MLIRVASLVAKFVWSFAMFVLFWQRWIHTFRGFSRFSSCFTQFFAVRIYVGLIGVPPHICLLYIVWLETYKMRLNAHTRSTIHVMINFVLKLAFIQRSTLEQANYRGLFSSWNNERLNYEHIAKWECHTLLSLHKIDWLFLCRFGVYLILQSMWPEYVGNSANASAFLPATKFNIS